MISIASRDAFGGFTFAAFSAKNTSVVVAVMIIPSLIESLMLLFQSKLLICCIFLKHITSFWFNRLFMDDLFRFYVICKKYTNAYGKNSNYTNAVDISII